MKIELLGSTSREELEKRIRTVCTAGRLSRFNGDVFAALEKSNDFDQNLKMIKRIISMGHESITDHDYLVFAIEGVSPIIEQTIIAERMSSFTIKSRREVNFSNVGYYIPMFKDKNGKVLPNQEVIKNKYCQHMQYLFDSYQVLIDKDIPKEDARFVLPYSYHSNIIMGVDAHILKNMIIEYTKGIKSNISEIYEFGQMLYDMVAQFVPYYKEIIADTKEHKVDMVRKKLDEYVINREYTIIDKPILIDSTHNIDANIIVSAIMLKYQFSYEKALEIYHNQIAKNSSLCKEIMREIYNGDQKELTQVSFQFQIPISLAVLTHITRHRTHFPLIPDFVPVHDLLQYKVPKTIERNCLALYHEIYRTNVAMYAEFKAMGVREEDLIYFHLSGNMVNMITRMDGKTLAWITRLRTCTKAQWEIQEIFNTIKKLVKEIAPIYGSILGPDCLIRSFCKEGKESCGRIEKLKKNNS